MSDPNLSRIRNYPEKQSCNSFANLICLLLISLVASCLLVTKISGCHMSDLLASNISGRRLSYLLGSNIDIAVDKA